MNKIGKILERIIFHTLLSSMTFIIGIFLGSFITGMSSYGFAQLIHECYGPPPPINTVEINGIRFERKRP